MGADELSAIVNYRRLSERIATAGQPSEEQLRWLARSGFELVVNLAVIKKPYSLPDERTVVEGLGMSYVHIPVVWEAPASEDLDEFFEVMRRNRDKRVFVHCALNMRVSAFMALYFIVHEGWPEETALALTREIWDPMQNEVWKAFIDRELVCRRPNGSELEAMP